MLIVAYLEGPELLPHKHLLVDVTASATGLG